MKKRILSALTAICLAASMTACAGSSSQTDTSAASSSSAESSSAADSSTSADSSSQAAPKYDYVHGADGYYNLADELKLFKTPVQQAGTCWLYAARASMQTSCEKATGKELKMEIYDMLEAIYGEGKQEGLFVNSSIDKSDLGGYQQFVADRLSAECKADISSSLPIGCQQNAKTALRWTAQ